METDYTGFSCERQRVQKLEAMSKIYITSQQTLVVAAASFELIYKAADTAWK